VIQVYSKTILHASTEAAWQVISDFGAACNYLHMVVSCTVEGVGVGALRRLSSADGSTIVECLVILDEVAHRLSYALVTDTPFRNCLTSICVDDLSGAWSEVTWSATFEADGIPASEAQDMLAGALTANSLALKQYLERGN
jgi:hypothetical protein